MNTGGSPRARNASTSSTDPEEERESNFKDDGAHVSTTPSSEDGGGAAVADVTTEMVGRWKTGTGLGPGVGVIVRRCIRLKVPSVATVGETGAGAGVADGDASRKVGHGAICWPMISVGAVETPRAAYGREES